MKTIQGAFWALVMMALMSMSKVQAQDIEVYGDDDDSDVFVFTQTDNPDFPDMPEMGDFEDGPNVEFQMHDGKHMEMGKEGMMKELNLTKDQIDKIKKIRTDAQKKNIPLKSDLQLKAIELRELMDSDSPDKDKIGAKIKEIDGIRTQIKINRTNAHIDVKNVFTKEQRDKMEQMRAERRFMPFMGKQKFMKKFKFEDRDN